MADIELVIKIDEETCNEVRWRELALCPRDEENLVRAIKNGTPLLKGHGDLIDGDALRKEILSWGMNDYEPSDFIDEIDMADVIIEADKENEE